MVLEDFPDKHGKDRENLILDIIDNQQERLSYEWYSLKLKDNYRELIVYIMTDALKIDGIRINVTPDTEQRIADKWGCSLLTPKLSDLAWHNADIRIEPRPRKISSSTAAMIAHSKDVDEQLNGDIKGKLVSTVGKNWVITNKLHNKPNRACNHGWHFKGSSFQEIKGNVNPSLLKNPKTGQYWRLIQPASTAHNPSHSDYSQICRLVTRECLLDGNKTDIMDIFRDDQLSFMVNHDGILTVTRMESVPPTTVCIV